MKTMPRAEWLIALKSKIEPVGDCMEWQGQFVGKTPVVYTPKSFISGYAFHANMPVRRVLYCLETGHRPPAGYVLRARCWNDSCVDPNHFELISRKQQVAEQSKRGELVTAAFLKARSANGRSQSKLTPEAVAEIRASTATGPVEAAKHGVSTTTINRIRSGVRWATSLPGASIFTLGQALANFKG